MTKIFEVNITKLNEKLAEELKKLDEFKMPEWAAFVKTSVAKARPPFEADFWYKRSASILRQLYTKGVVGVNRLKTRYGGRQNRGAKPAKFRKGGGKIIRTILQQAESANFVEKVKGKRSGRQLTEKGRKFLNNIAEMIKNNDKKSK